MPKQSAQAFNAGIDALLALYAPDVVCYPAPGWVDATVCRGHDGFRELSAVWGDKVDHPALEVHEVRDMGERLLILAEFIGIAKDSGAPVRQPFGVINSDLREDGKVGEARFFLSWEAAREAAEAGP
jgi:SnoaL-like domain